MERRTRTGGTADQRGRAGFFFGFMAFWPGLETGFFFDARGFFRADARILFFLVFFWCFFLFFWVCFCALGCFGGVSRVSAKKKLVFFRRRHEQNREFPLCKGVERRTRTGGTADQNGWNGGPRGWNGGQAGLERRTTRVERRTGRSRTADHEGGTSDRPVWNERPNGPS